MQQQEKHKPINWNVRIFMRERPVSHLTLLLYKYIKCNISVLLKGSFQTLSAAFSLITSLRRDKLNWNNYWPMYDILRPWALVTWKIKTARQSSKWSQTLSRFTTRSRRRKAFLRRRLAPPMSRPISRLGAQEQD